ncbi:Nicotinamide mononucleotide transporter PnuC [Candidatus Sulfotelmatomonas gaucii]|uniref:Nicotinamide riboside transporter PnuC n=1 Tax=Candidatus Sulfuritelmatomonas gaucii TaxID=2043161 RepID=A0A2N9L2M0_9BACT|nr:Nicotinamide mononucleotide transporter PnuC [Candidatus Sulfotelmatomonas gaucii]
MTETAIVAWLAAHGLEITGAITAALGIWLTTRRLLICWPVTLISIFLYMVVFYRAGLLSDALLQVFFVIFTFYGWWHWWRGMRREGEVRVAPLRRSSLVVAVVLGVPGSFALGILAKHLHAALPYLDAVLMSYSLVATWWQARKHIANWWLWIVVDAVYIGEYIYKDLWPTALLYAGLVGLAILGLRDWRRAPMAAAEM